MDEKRDRESERIKTRFETLEYFVGSLSLSRLSGSENVVKDEYKIGCEPRNKMETK